MSHTTTPEAFAAFTATTVLAAAHGASAYKSLELRVTFDTTPETLRYVVQTEGREHFFDHLPAAIAAYNSY